MSIQGNNTTERDVITPINLSPLDSDKVELTCHLRHCFERSAMEAWFRTASTCPVCLQRASINPRNNAQTGEISSVARSRFNG